MLTILFRRLGYWKWKLMRWKKDQRVVLQEGKIQTFQALLDELHEIPTAFTLTSPISANLWEQDFSFVIPAKAGIQGISSMKLFFWKSIAFESSIGDWIHTVLDAGSDDHTWFMWGSCDDTGFLLIRQIKKYDGFLLRKGSRHSIYQKGFFHPPS